MKIYKLLFIISLVVLSSCKEKKEPLKNEVNQKVKHYICKNNCENSGGSIQGVCPTCSTPYIHNQAFHNEDFLKAGPLDVPVYDGTNNNTNTPSQPEPVRNALGVYHYTCTNGCGGGAGSAVSCKECGNTLVHNTAYHNN